MIELTNITILTFNLLTNTFTNATGVTVDLADGSVCQIHQRIVVEGGQGTVGFSLNGQPVSGPFQFVSRMATNNILGALKPLLSVTKQGKP